MHTNDFHGRLETDYRGRGGSAYIAGVVNDIRAEAGEENVALLDAGDVYFAAPAISQLLMGESTIDVYNLMGYDVAAFGNHEFDKGQESWRSAWPVRLPLAGRQRRPGRHRLGPADLGAAL